MKILDIRPLLSKIDFGRSSQFTSLKPVLSLEHLLLLDRSRYCNPFMPIPILICTRVDVFGLWGNDMITSNQ